MDLAVAYHRSVRRWLAGCAIAAVALSVIGFAITYATAPEGHEDEMWIWGLTVVGVGILLCAIVLLIAFIVVSIHYRTLAAVRRDAKDDS